MNVRKKEESIESEGKPAQPNSHQLPSYLVHLLQFVSDGRKPSHELVQPLLAQLLKPLPCPVSLTGEGVQFC